MTYKEEAMQLKEALENLVRMGEVCIDPDEPFYEWVDGLVQALDEAKDLLRKTKC